MTPGLISVKRWISVDEVAPGPRMVDVLSDVPSVAAAIETNDDAVWKEFMDPLEGMGGSLTVS